MQVVVREEDIKTPERPKTQKIEFPPTKSFWRQNSKPEFQVVVREQNQKTDFSKQSRKKIKRKKKKKKRRKYLHHHNFNDAKNTIESEVLSGARDLEKNRNSRRIVSGSGQDSTMFFPNFPPQEIHTRKPVVPTTRPVTIHLPKAEVKSLPTPYSLQAFLRPPYKNAPVANFRQRQNSKKHRDESLLPARHPLTRVLPSRARVVGIKPLRSIPLSNRQNHPDLLTLSEFLNRFPEMNHVRAIPIEVEGRDADMIEHLARGNIHSKYKKKRKNLLEKLEAIISSSRESRKISPAATIKHIPVQPRGKEPSQSIKNLRVNAEQPESFAGEARSTLKIPELEFGFVPLTSSATAKAVPVTPSSAIDGGSRNESSTEDGAFFFTTTEAPSTDNEKPVKGKKKKSKLSSLFDMRNLFYIPPHKKTKPKRRLFQTDFSP